MRRTVVAMMLAVGACTAPRPPHVTAPHPAPIVVPPLPVGPTDWRDKPYTPGAWHYADGVASYGPLGAPPLATISCDRATRIVAIARAGAAPSMTIRTSYAERSWPAQATADGHSRVTFAASDPVLDQIAFTRGRFSLGAPGLTELDLPAWAEPARVVEDCRN